MDAIEEVKKSLYETYKGLYVDAIDQVKFCLAYAKKRRESGKMGWAADWLESANNAYKRAQWFKRSMEFYAS